MTIPDFQTIMLPLLNIASDGEARSLSDSREALSDFFKLSDEERKDLLPSGTQPIFNNRVAWASIYLHRAGLLSRPKRGWYQITDRALEILKDNPQKIDIKYLMRFPEFVEFREKKKGEEITGENDEGTKTTNPEEALEASHQELKRTLASDLLQAMKECSPTFFERLVIDVLLNMGYGGSRKEAGQAMGQSGDEGIDGIIKEDKLGLDAIYIQAKRWGNTVVGRPEIQKFAGALIGQKARKGIFITTSTFSKEALGYVKNIENKIILIDGKQLAELMIDYNVGVSPIASYEIKKLDTDYFTDE